MGDKFTATTLPAFNPPGFPYQDDKLDPAQRASWSATISEWMTNEINGQYRDEDGQLKPLPGPCHTDRTKLPQFFNGTVTPFNVGQKPTPVSWIGFPNLVQVAHPQDVDRWRIADGDRGQQDEYLEWTVKSDEKNGITSVTFTCEGPEYWAFLSQQDPNKMLELYKQYNPTFADKMKVEDMFDNGVYNPYNQWNGVILKDPNDDRVLTTVNPGCIMHLAQRNNTLSAEIDIAAQGTIIRKDKNGNIITDRTKLCNCSKYGQASRNSDPQIGSSINGLAIGGNSISIADPVGIYMMQFDKKTFMLDQDGTGDNLVPVPAGTFTWARGNIDKQMGLRLHIEVPAGVMGTGDNDGRQMTVSDLVDTKSGQNIMYGAQFADYIHMVVNGVTISDVPAGEPQFCPCDGKKTKNGVSSLMATEDGGPKRIPFKRRHD